MLSRMDGVHYLQFHIFRAEGEVCGVSLPGMLSYHSPFPSLRTPFEANTLQPYLSVTFLWLLPTSFSKAAALFHCRLCLPLFGVCSFIHYSFICLTNISWTKHYVFGGKVTFIPIIRKLTS